MKRYSETFKKFGAISARIFAIIVMIMIMVGIMNVIVKGLPTGKFYGFSYRLGAAFCESITNKIIRKAKKQRENEFAELGEIELKEIEV